TKAPAATTPPKAQVGTTQPRAAADTAKPKAAPTTSTPSTKGSEKSKSADNDSLARYIGNEYLKWYVEFQRVENHADAWRKTAASKILNDPTAGALIEDLLGQYLARISNAFPGFRNNGTDLMAIAKHLVTAGFLVATHRDTQDPNGGRATIVVKGAFR